MFNVMTHSRGFSLVEVIVGAAIISMALFGIFRFLSFSAANAAVSAQFAQANALSQGALEAVRSFRDGIAWNNDDPNNQYDGLGVLATGISHRIQKSGDNPPQWQITQGTETIGAFQRSVIFSSVNRDGTDSITQSGGATDPDTKKVAVQVSWNYRGQNYQVSAGAYLTNWK